MTKSAAAKAREGRASSASAVKASNRKEADAKAPARVAILGFGTVGSSVAQLLRAQKFPGIELTHVYNRGIERKRTGPTAKGLGANIVWSENVDEVLASDADIIIETIGGITPIESWVKKALARGKHVVTANKQLIAYKGAALARLAREHNAMLVYNAAVAGGVPVIPATLHGLQGDRITRVSGILNGTCNFILSHMEGGAEYADVLRQAQAAGYAEADPAADVDGYDARAKLCILVRAAMQAGIDPDQVAAQTIRHVSAVDFQYARELGCTIRQISHAELEGNTVHARVGPMLVPRTSPVAWSHGTQNLVVTTGDFGGDVVFSGHGAGGNPTAVAIVSDLLAVVHGSNPVALPVRKRAVTGEFKAPYYLRFIVRDKPGIVSAISGALAKVGANIDSILQRPGFPKDALPFVVTTEPCLTSTITAAVKAIHKMPSMLEPPLCMQMLVDADKAED